MQTYAWAFLRCADEFHTSSFKRGADIHQGAGAAGWNTVVLLQTLDSLNPEAAVPRQSLRAPSEGGSRAADLRTRDQICFPKWYVSYIFRFEMNGNVNRQAKNIMAKPCAAGWRAEIERLDGAYSEHTLRSYRSDFTIFEAWCVRNGREPLPATPELVAEFIAADAARSATSTLKRRLAAIRKVHRLMRMPCPVDDEEVAIALRRAMRSKRRRPQQALGLTAEMRDQLIAASPDTLIGLRDRAMIAIGYDTLCRRSELVCLQLEDLTRQPDGGAKILVRRAKNDPFGDGRWAYLSASALAHLDRWFNAANLTEGLVLRAVIQDTVQEKGLLSVAISRRLKAAAQRAGLATETTASLSGHSMRVGAAQDLMTAGRSLLQIMSAGGWTSVNVVGRYVRDADLNVWANRPREVKASI